MKMFRTLYNKLFASQSEAAGAAEWPGGGDLMEYIRGHIARNTPPVIEDMLRNCRLVNELGQPYARSWTYNDFYLSMNIKNIMARFAEERIKRIEERKVADRASSVGLTSKLSTQEDMESDWCRYWLAQIKLDFRYYRKLWENAFVLQVLYENGMFGRKGIGFACGNERLPSYLAKMNCEITAGDKPFDQNDAMSKAWLETNQYTEAKENLFFQDIVEREIFEKNVSLQYIDMNNIPADLENSFDFCWSVCAMEHLGSIENGCEFLKNSLKILKPGGISVHTTEINIFSNTVTIDNSPDVVLFTRGIFDKLEAEINNSGIGKFYSFDYVSGSDFFDKYIDVPPFPYWPYPSLEEKMGDFGYIPHLKLLYCGFPITCAGIIIKRL